MTIDNDNNKDNDDDKENITIIVIICAPENVFIYCCYSHYLD